MLVQRLFVQLLVANNENNVMVRKMVAQSDNEFCVHDRFVQCGYSFIGRARYEARSKCEEVQEVFRGHRNY